MKIEKDGNMYCVKADNFVDLQESGDYFFIDEAEYQAFLLTARAEGRAEIMDNLEERFRVYIRQEFAKLFSEADLTDIEWALHNVLSLLQDKDTTQQ